MAWATPCKRNVECADGSDEEGCESPLSITILVLICAGLVLHFYLSQQDSSYNIKG